MSKELQLVEDGVHQTSLVVDALFQGNHGFRSADTFNIIYFKNDVLRVGGIPCPDFTENIEFTRSDVGHGYIRNLAQPFQNKFGLVGFFEEYADIGYKGVA